MDSKSLKYIALTVVVTALVVLAVTYFVWFKPLSYPLSVRECLDVKGFCLDAVAMIKHDPSICELKDGARTKESCVRKVEKVKNGLSAEMRHDFDWSRDCPAFNWSCNGFGCVRMEVNDPYKDYQRILFSSDLENPQQPDLYMFNSYAPFPEKECQGYFNGSSAAQECAGIGYSAGTVNQGLCYEKFAIVHKNITECDLIVSKSKLNISVDPKLRSDIFLGEILDRCRLSIAVSYDDPSMCKDSEMCWWYFAEAKLIPSYCDNMQDNYLNGKWIPFPRICKAAVLAQLGQ